VLGPLLFNRSVEDWVDFHARIADEADVDRVHLGEVVCSKRRPFYAEKIPAAIERLTRAGKTVVVDTLALVTLKRERQLVAEVASIDGVEIEINDFTPLATLPAGRRFAVSPLVNVYDEGTYSWLAARGAWSIALPPELPFASIELLAETGRGLGVETQMFAFGRLPLAVSSRCYHARIHGFAKDNCRFVCMEDADGLDVDTLDGEKFLAINGVQTLSQGCVAALDETERLIAAGIGGFRLSPQACDMVAVAATFRARLAGAIDAEEARSRIRAAGLKPTLAPPMMSRSWPVAPTGHRV
jgi:collagenase-like PrtC family protease